MTIQKPSATMPTSRHDLARRIDETKLVFAPTEDPQDTITKLCQNAVKEEFRSVCVRPEWVKLAKSIVNGTKVLVATVIGFPKGKVPLAEQQAKPTFGNFSWQDKVVEMKQAIVDGADEFDIVMNHSLMRSLMATNSLSNDNFELVHLVQNAGGLPIKLIIEADLLSSEEIKTVTRLAVEAGIDIVKTSTGMLDGGKGATVENISLIRQTIEALPAPGNNTQIKASGGVRTANQALDLIQVGADVLGSSSGSSLLNDFDTLHQKAGESTTSADDDGY